MKFRIFWLALTSLLAFSPTVSIASVLTLEFVRITTNSSQNIASQLSTQVRDQSSALADFNVSLAADETLFTFHNNVGIASNLSEVYFDDGVIFQQTSIINSLNWVTNFTNGGNNGINPSNLPSGGNVNPGFVATAGFGADTQGNPNNSVNTSNDVLGIVIQLFPGLDFTDVHNALIDGSLRLGLHVRGIGGSGGVSDSFVNIAASRVPVPMAIWLFATGLISLVTYKRTSFAIIQLLAYNNILAVNA